MNILSLFAVATTFLFSFRLVAEVRFNCYENPNMGAMAYQVGGSNCEPGSAKGSVDSANKMFCSYTAICEALGSNQPPTQLTNAQVEELSQNLYSKLSNFKHSIVTCSGKSAALDPESKTLIADCPSINNCAIDIAFNGGPAMVNGEMNLGRSNSTGNVIITSPNLNKSGPK